MLKNAYSNPKQSAIDKVQKILIQHKAKYLSFEYDDKGRVKTLIFCLEIKNEEVWFKMPAMVENVAQVLRTNPDSDQAYRTAWANIRDWVDAQMALIDTRQVKIEQVFLPYMLIDKTHTLFDVYEDKGFAKLTAPIEGEVVNND